MDTFLLYISEWAGAVAVAMIAGISLRFKRTRLVFKFPRREGIVALGVFVFLMLLAVILATFAPFSVLGLPVDLSRRIFLAAAGLVPVGVALWRRKQPVRSAGWPQDKLSPALQLGLALAFLTIFLRGKFTALLSGLNGSELEMLGFSLIVALLEETTFRGYIQPRLAAWWGAAPGWLATAGFYVLWQLPRLLAAPDTFLMNLIIITAQSLVASYIMQRSSHVLSPALYRAVSDWLFFIQ